MRRLALPLLAAALIGCQEKTSVPAPSPVDPMLPPPRAELRDRLIKEHHDRCVEQFVKAMGFGKSRMPSLTHVSTDYPKSFELPDDTQSASPRPVPWVMDKVELVGLIMNPKPGVYPAGKTERYAFRRPKARDLDAFEGAALARLEGGDEVCVEEAAGGLRVLGAIRMRAECANCHSDKAVGSVVGALSYVLKPAE